MNLAATRYTCSKRSNKTKIRDYRLMRTNMMLSIKKSIFYWQLSNRFKRYKPIGLNKINIIMILLDLARGRTIQP
jgi:hypothetical protein